MMTNTKRILHKMSGTFSHFTLLYLSCLVTLKHSVIFVFHSVTMCESHWLSRKPLNLFKEAVSVRGKPISSMVPCVNPGIGVEEPSCSKMLADYGTKENADRLILHPVPVLCGTLLCLTLVPCSEKWLSFFCFLNYICVPFN